jgi:hypothetical protein
MFSNHLCPQVFHCHLLRNPWRHRDVAYQSYGRRYSGRCSVILPAFARCCLCDATIQSALCPGVNLRVVCKWIARHVRKAPRFERPRPSRPVRHGTACRGRKPGEETCMICDTRPRSGARYRRGDRSAHQSRLDSGVQEAVRESKVGTAQRKKQLIELMGGSVRSRWGADSASKAPRRMGASFHCLRVPRRDNATRSGRDSLRTAQ